jgi:acyl-CoA reductase-like NAD-dependent aldehyde dehydrogenase
MSTVAGLTIAIFIAGELVHDTSCHITHVNPATGEVNHEVCAGTEAQIDAAVNPAQEPASAPAWRNMLPHYSRRSC